MGLSVLLIERFAEIFSGNKEAFGKFVINGKDGDKVTGRAMTEIGQVKKEYYEQHLEGKKGLGIVPINKDNKCIFGVIDIDDYDVDYKNLQEKINANNFPLVMFLSKSGGVHLYLFLEEFAEAGFVQDCLSFFSIILGYKNTEVFPKQRQLTTQSKTGNWINLPYFDYEKTKRPILNGEDKLDLFTALEHIKNNTISKKQLNEFVKNFPHKDAPPCLQFLLNGDVDSNRNNFLFNVGIYYKQYKPDSWEDKLNEANSNLSTPVKFGELSNTIVNSLKKKEYFYQCSLEPMVSYCDKALCRLRKFGINSDSMPSEIIGDLIKYDFIPPLWKLNVNGVYLNLKTEELMSHNHYQKKCFEILHTWPKGVKTEIWRKIVEERLGNVVVKDAPEEASPDGRFKSFLMEYCTERAEATSKDQMFRGRVYTEDNYHYFRGKDFLDFLRNNSFTYYSSTQSFIRFEELGGIRMKIRIGKKQIRCWRIKVINNPKLVVKTSVVNFDKFNEEPY